MFIPIQHESNEGRRWPFITMAIVLMNIAAFLGTHSRMQQESPQFGEVRAHLIVLAATHPGLTIPQPAADFIETFKKDSPDLWRLAQNPARDVEDAWDARMRMIDEPEALQREMDSLAEQFVSLRGASIAQRFGFVRAHPAPISYITSTFLHGGWMHIIFNMWFLWLAGAILEDTWGRIIYPIFYLTAGAAACVFYAWLNPGSPVPTIGASGAVAGLMGAFLVRFPKTKIDVAVVLGPRSLARLAVGEGIRFKAAALWLLPLWLLSEILSGVVFGHHDGVAHWAHVGGFVFGGLFALGLRHSGLEDRINHSIEAKVTWTADEGYVQAAELMEQNKLTEALSTLNSYIATKPNSIEAATLLPQILWRMNDIGGYRNAILKLCQLHLQAHDLQAALADFQEFQNSGGDEAPVAVWLELCRGLENEQQLERAVEEYQKLAAAYPLEKQSVLALVAAGRLCLKRLNRPQDALHCYEKANTSKVPHMDWQPNIETGMNEAKAALAKAGQLAPR
jgi:membrane associated rhomboid family serine protease